MRARTCYASVQSLHLVHLMWKKAKVLTKTSWDAHGLVLGYLTLPLATPHLLCFSAPSRLRVPALAIAFAWNILQDLSLGGPLSSFKFLPKCHLIKEDLP